MAGEEYKRRLDIHRKKLGFGQELVDIVSSELKVACLLCSLRSLLVVCWIFV